MSLDISLENKKTGELIIEMNWLRNPFGLCQWAEDNTNTHDWKKGLWYVINHWNYGKSNRVNRELFKKVVDKHQEIIENLQRGYFFFSLSSYVQFVQPHYDLFPKEKLFTGDYYIKDSKYDDKKRLMIPMEYFDKPEFNLSSDVSLKRYKKWFGALVEFASLLQNKNNKFHCSN